MPKEIKMVKKVVVIAGLLFATSVMSMADMLGPDDLSPEQKETIEKYRLDFIKANRLSEKQQMPEFFKTFKEKYKEYCLKLAQEEYKKHGRWFYCQDYRKFGDGYKRWDEVVTFRIYWSLINYYGGLEKIPDYSKENHEKAIKFWQSWQYPDGSFKNPFDAKTPINYKYVPSILELLGARALYKSTIGVKGGSEKINLNTFWSGCTTFHGLNGQAAVASEMFTKIHEGKTEYIPALERGIEIFLSRMNSKTGMFHENKIPQNKQWSEYGTTANHMKCLSRLVGYSGVENMPYRHRRADTLIAKQRYFQLAGVDVLRNTAEMYMQCIEESPYQREALLKALAKNALAYHNDQPWKSHLTGDYTIYAIQMFGPLLNWDGYEEKTPRTPHYNGIANSYRIMIGPFGRCANIIEKTPEEMPWHKDWSIEKYGLQTRNTEYDRREVVDIVPVCQNNHWQESRDVQGRFVLTQTFNLKDTELENPYLKMQWSGGDIEIYVNNIFIKKKLAGLNQPEDKTLSKFGAVYIPSQARKALQKGQNIIKIISNRNADNAPQVRIGLIDWMPWN